MYLWRSEPLRLFIYVVEELGQFEHKLDLPAANGGDAGAWPAFDALDPFQPNGQNSLNTICAASGVILILMVVSSQWQKVRR